MRTTLRFTGHELLRLRRDMATLFFSIGLPIFFYLIFGALQDYGDQKINGGNLAAFVMLGMAFYAGVVGAVGAPYLRGLPVQQRDLRLNMAGVPGAGPGAGLHGR